MIRSTLAYIIKILFYFLSAIAAGSLLAVALQLMMTYFGHPLQIDRQVVWLPVVSSLLWIPVFRLWRMSRRWTQKTKMSGKNEPGRRAGNMDQTK